MTVCIAAICNGGRSVVVCADRMFTNPGLSVEFETSERKIETIGKSCVVMPAGNSVNATEVIEDVRRKMGNDPKPKFPEIAEIFRQEYASVRNKMVYQNVIVPMLGADFEQFRTRLPLPTYLEKQPNAFQAIGAMSAQQNLQVELLICGIDNTGAHLFHVTNPGIYGQLDKLGYAAVGSGGIHATIRLSLSGQTKSRDLSETLADVYNAKRAAEVAPGVGEATDIAVIDASGINFCSGDILEELKRIHENASWKPTLILDDLKKKFNEPNAKS